MRDAALYAIGLGLYPALFLYAHNVHLLSLDEVAGPLALLLAVVTGLWLGVGRLLRDYRKAGLLVAALSLWTMSYSHLAGLLQGTIRQDRVLLAGWGVALLLAVVGLLRIRRVPDGLAQALNAGAAVLLLFPLITIVPHEIRVATLPKMAQQGKVMAGTASAQMPNIYHIVLDGYARGDVLRSRYATDNSAFLQALQARGFTVSPRARTNYAQTLLSLSSTLNLDYLEALTACSGSGLAARAPLKALVAENRALTTLQARGYRTVAFATGYPGTELRGADVFYDEVHAPTQFQNALLNLTPVPALVRRVNPEVLSEYYQHRRHVECAFQNLPRVQDHAAPVYVFAHIICPHPPFVFAADGAPAAPDRAFALAEGSHFRQRGGTREEYVRGYTAQLAFINAQALRTVDGILAHATRPTVIIVQSDHGPGAGLDWDDPAKTDLPERMGILLAVHTPDGEPLLPSDGTPVNLYRALFARYLGEALPPLPNRSFFSTWGAPYQFIPYTTE